MLRLLRLISGDQASGFSGTEGIEVFSARIEPHSPGLAKRVWYGAGGMDSARWAGENGLNLLTSSVIRAENELSFAEIQQRQIQAFRAAHPDGQAARASQGLVVLPTDSASPAQRDKYAAYVAARTPRTQSPQGPQRLLFAKDIVGTSAEIAEELYEHAGFREVREVAFALPFDFEPEDYIQLLTDIADHLGPALGWRRAPHPPPR